MGSIVEKIKSNPDAIFGRGVSENEIAVAEAKLDLKFSAEYRDYLHAFSVVAIDGHELTGITSNKRVDVVEVTKCQRQNASEITNELYVVEETNIDGIVIWQKSSGEVYQTSPGMRPVLVANSLEKYLDL